MGNTAGDPDDATQIEGATDGTKIGNSSDALKTAVQNFPATQAISAVSLPLPAGASTSAKQPALGTAGSASADVITVQGIASMTALKTDGSATTQPISAASLPLPTGSATAANQSTEITALQLIDDLPHAANDTLVKAVPLMGQLDDTSTATVTEDHVGVVRITGARALHTNLHNNAGTEVGTSTTPLRVDPTGTTTQPVNVSSITLSAGQVPTFSNKLVCDITTTTISVTSSVTYTTIYTYTGSGLLVGYSHEYNNVAIIEKLVVDGNTVFDGVDISTLNGFLVTANTVDRRQNGQGLTTLSAAIDFSMRQPIRFTASVVISARLTSGAVAKTFSQGIVYIQKDT